MENHCVIPQNASLVCEGMRSTNSSVEHRDSVVCPKPRRLNAPIRPLRWHLNHQVELCESKAGTELLDIILAKEGYGSDQMLSPVVSSPFFCGSPPSRSANPLVHDTHFGNDKLHSASPLQIPLGLSSSPSAVSPRKGCARAKLGLKPAAVRIEGFNCLERDRQNHSIPAVA